MYEEKNIKNPAVMAELFELLYCTSVIVPENKLSHKPQFQYGFITKLSHPSGKNTGPLVLKNISSTLTGTGTLTLIIT